MRKVKRTYTEEQFKKAVTESKSIRHALQLLGLKPMGGGYSSFHKAAKEFNVDTNHFTGQGHTSGKKLPHKVRPIEDYFEGKVSITSHSLKLRMIKEGIFKAECSNDKCKRDAWNDLPIPLELDHIDGNHGNNKLDNLRILCPNCHAQTATYRRSKTSRTMVDNNKCLDCNKQIGTKANRCRDCDFKNRKRLRELRKSDPNFIPEPEVLVYKKDVENICNHCTKSFFANKKQKYCSYDCSRLGSRKFEVTKEELEKLIWEMSTVKIADMFKVSDKAIEKRCKQFGIDKPPRGYWMKNKKPQAP